MSILKKMCELIIHILTNKMVQWPKLISFWYVCTILMSPYEIIGFERYFLGIERETVIVVLHRLDPNLHYDWPGDRTLDDGDLTFGLEMVLQVSNELNPFSGDGIVLLIWHQCYTYMLVHYVDVELVGQSFVLGGYFCGSGDLSVVFGGKDQLDIYQHSVNLQVGKGTRALLFVVNGLGYHSHGLKKSLCMASCWCTMNKEIGENKRRCLVAQCWGYQFDVVDGIFGDLQEREGYQWHN